MLMSLMISVYEITYRAQIFRTISAKIQANEFNYTSAVTTKG